MPDDPVQTRPPYAPLPSGQHRLGAELVSLDQRARLNAAMVQVAAEYGYSRATVGRILSRAGVSRRTFYEHYDNKLGCFLAACDDVLEDWMRRAARAYRQASRSQGPDATRARLTAALRTLWELLDADPLGGQVIFREALNCGIAGVHRLEQAADELDALVDQAFETEGATASLPAGLRTVIVGGVMEIVTTRLRHGTTKELSGLTEPLTQWMLGYRSPNAAAQIARARDLLSDPQDPPDISQAQESIDVEDEAPLWRNHAVRPIAVRDATERIIDAAAEIAAGSGYAALSSNEICRVAGVSHHTFRKHFASSDDAFVAAYRAGSKETIAYCLTAFASESGWPAAVHAGLSAELRFFTIRPTLARLGFFEIYAAGPEALHLRESELQLFTAALEPGYAISTRPPHRVVSEAIAGGIYQLIRKCMLHSGPERLPVLVPEVTYAALAPFIGAEAAAAAATRG
jgi:AcrR family transcriptional regulator